MKKVYAVESYNSSVIDYATDLIGVYSSKGKAIEAVKKIAKDWRENYDKDDDETSIIAVASTNLDDMSTIQDDLDFDLFLTGKDLYELLNQKPILEVDDFVTSNN